MTRADVCVCVCVWKNTENPKEIRVICVCCVMLWGVKIQKENCKNKKTRSPLLTRHVHARIRKRSKNDEFSQRLVLALSLGFFNVFDWYLSLRKFILTDDNNYFCIRTQLKNVRVIVSIKSCSDFTRRSYQENWTDLFMLTPSVSTFFFPRYHSLLYANVVDLMFLYVNNRSVSWLKEMSLQISLHHRKIFIDRNLLKKLSVLISLNMFLYNFDLVSIICKKLLDIFISIHLLRIFSKIYYPKIRRSTTTCHHVITSKSDDHSFLSDVFFACTNVRFIDIYKVERELWYLISFEESEVS